jgi:uncharacterized protein GlcG (DUF336 family)
MTPARCVIISSFTFLKSEVEVVMVILRFKKRSAARAAILLGALVLPTAAFATQPSSGSCPVSYPALKAALEQATAQETSGLDNDMWGTVVDRDGIVCAVAFTGSNRGSQWPGSRVISAQKANTANAFSLPIGAGGISGLALSTANLFSAVQPGGSLFGLQESNPVDFKVAYGGSPSAYGTSKDPMVGQRIGGVNVFGGGLALYDRRRQVVGAIGVSGDTSCADHFIGWRARNILRLDFVPAGVSGDGARPDNIVFDITGGVSANGFGHPTCLATGDPATLPAVPSLTASGP